jgi:hypothetical protein
MRDRDRESRLPKPDVTGQSPVSRSNKPIQNLRWCRASHRSNRIECGRSTLRLGENAGGLGDADEGFGLLVVLGDAAFDGDDQLGPLCW